MHSTFKMKGAKELKEKIKRLQDLGKDASFDDGDYSKNIRGALRRAASVVRKRAVELAKDLDDKETPNAIWKNIRVTFDNRHFRKTGQFRFKIGIAGGAKSQLDNDENKGGDTYYWRYLEFGTSKMAARPFMRPALESSKDAVMDEFFNEMTKVIDRALKDAGV